MSIYRPFKQTERAVARLLGGRRTGHTGGADVTAGWLVAEVKHRASIPAWLRAAVNQAQRNATELQLPVAVIHQHGADHAGDLVVMTMANFRDFFVGEDQEQA